MKASDLLLKCLQAHGVTAIYGLPGEENADVMISLKDTDIEFISCPHEQVASFMADMHGRLTGRPGVCLATLGPGATNLLTGVANANMDNIPLIAIIGQVSTHRLHKESHQNMDAVSMFKPVTKWATSILDPDTIPEIVQKAFKVATTGRPGAVLIELPEDIAALDTTAEVITSPHFLVETDVYSSQLATALQLIKDSKCPLFLIGSGAAAASSDICIRQLLEKTNMCATHTFMGKGVVASRTPYSLGCVGLGMKDIALKAFERADLVICIGYHMVEWHPENWAQGPGQKVIHIDVAPAEVDAHYLPEVELVGHINSIVETIYNNITDEHCKKPGILEDIRQDILKDLTRYDKDTDFPIKPQRILYDIRSVMRDDDIVISDVGAHKMWVARQYTSFQSKSCFIYNGFCSMGGAIPGAVEAKRLFPEKNVVAVCGDGGFMMSVQALVVAARYEIPIVVIVWEDGHYGLIEWKQEMHFHETSNIDLFNPDFVTLAQSIGCEGERVEAVSELVPKLVAALSNEKLPTVLVVPVDYRENMKLTKHLGEIIAH